MLAKKILRSIPYSIRVLRRLSAHSLDGEITVQQFRILNLANEGMGQTQMAHALQVSMAAVSKMVDPLVKIGLLTRSPGADRRCHHLKLTPEGKKLHKRVKQQVEKVLSRNFDRLTKEERSDLERGLDVLDKLMGFQNEV